MRGQKQATETFHNWPQEPSSPYRPTDVPLEPLESAKTRRVGRHDDANVTTARRRVVHLSGRMFAQKCNRDIISRVKEYRVISSLFPRFTFVLNALDRDSRLSHEKRTKARYPASLRERTKDKLQRFRVMNGKRTCKRRRGGSPFTNFEP